MRSEAPNSAALDPKNYVAARWYVVDARDALDDRSPARQELMARVAAPIAGFPLVGWKDSFVGDLHANGADAVRFYMKPKVTSSRWVRALRPSKD
jgi:hypothetical protein